MDDLGNDGSYFDQSGDQVCHGYRDCLKLIEQGMFDEAAELIAEIWPIDRRYARALGDKLEVARRWHYAKSDEKEREKFWQWMDSRL